MLTYKSFGARGFTCQQSRIDQGFIELGLVESPTPDFIYCNDLGEFDAAYVYRKYKSPNSKLILNILDIPLWINNLNIQKIYDQILRADKITCISKFVQGQLKHIFNINSEVIYNPSKNIDSKERDFGIKKFPQYKYLMVGRLRDQSKRADMAIRAITYRSSESLLVVAGSEDVGYGHYLGVVSDEQLNSLYNSVDYVLMPSAQEGLGLPGCEAILGGAIPIVCHDLSTFSEFYPQHWGCYPKAETISMRIDFLESNKEIKEELFQEVKSLQPIINKKLNYIEVANRIIKLI